MFTRRALLNKNTGPLLTRWGHNRGGQLSEARLITARLPADLVGNLGRRSGYRCRTRTAIRLAAAGKQASALRVAGDVGGCPPSPRSQSCICSWVAGAPKSQVKSVSAAETHGNAPAHPPLACLNLGQRSLGNKQQGHVAGVQVRQ